MHIVPSSHLSGTSMCMHACICICSFSPLNHTTSLDMHALTCSFSLSFGEDVRGVWGDPKTYYFFLHVGAAPNSDYAATIPLSVYAMFQLMFAIITVALITGSFAGGLGGRP